MCNLTMIIKFVTAVLVLGSNIHLLSAQISFGRENSGNSPSSSSSAHTIRARLPTWRTRKTFPPILSILSSSSEEEEDDIRDNTVEVHRTNGNGDRIQFGYELSTTTRLIRRRTTARPTTSTTTTTTAPVTVGPIPYNKTYECTQYNMCNSLLNYPSNKIRKALENEDSMTRRLIQSFAEADNDISGSAGRTNDPGDITIEVRANLPQEQRLEKNVCNTRTDRLLPRGALNTNGDFKWILNQPEGQEKYIQVVDTTICQDSGSECLSGRISGHETRCQQEYTEHKLIALNESGDELVIDTFKFPSCCTCQVIDSLEF